MEANRRMRDEQRRTATLLEMAGKVASDSGGSRTSEANRLMREEQRRTTTLLEMARMVGSTLELDEVLHRVAGGLKAVAHADYCWFYLVLHEELSVLLWAETANSSPTFSAAARPLLNRPIEFPAGCIVRQALEQQRPLCGGGAPTDPDLDDEVARRLGVKSVLAAPFVVRGEVLGVAVLARVDDPAGFCSAEVEMTWGVANVAAPALQNAWLYRKAGQVAVAQERSRLSREMHDSLAQTLSYLNLKSAVVADLLVAGKIDQARAGLTELMRTAEEAYQDLREALFCLRAAVPSGKRFYAVLRQYLEEYSEDYGIDVRLAGESATLFAEGVELQLSRIILEALTNVRKHARAKTAWVRFGCEGDEGVISVEDHGRGFDVARATAGGRTHFGLQIMRERAESVGGALEVHSQPGEGTRVVVRVPLLFRG